MADTSSSRRSLTIIGCGKLGQTLGRLWATQKVFRIQQILNRSLATAGQAVEFIGSGVAIDSLAQLQTADIYLVATPDDQIKEVAEKLAASPGFAPDALVFHCSGALPSTILQVLRDKGASIASVHPIKSFASPARASASFAGTWCGMEGDSTAVSILGKAFEAIDGKTVPIRTQDKLIYHAAAVFASNYLVTLLDAALQAYMKAGIPENIAREMLGPLVNGTLENVMRIGPEHALTGPVARGDHHTVIRQYRALATWDGQYARLYKQMAIHTGRLAARRK